MVLGGYSQGAAVVDLATRAMPSVVADHVAATALFGGPRSSSRIISRWPPARSRPLYAAKTIELCVPDDPICSEGGWGWGAHSADVQPGMVDQAASFAVERL